MTKAPQIGSTESALDQNTADGWDWLDMRLPQVTTTAVSVALVGYSLALDQGRDAPWLALAVRRVLSLTVPEPSADPATRLGQAEIQKKLRVLASKTQELWLALSTMGQAEEDAVDDFLFSQRGEAGLLTVMNMYGSRRDDLMTLFSILSATANTITSGPGKQNARWRQKAQRHLRVERGHHLAAVFELAFDQSATANDYPSGKATAPTHFMDFYQRMVSVAFGERATPDLAGIIKQTVREHRKHPLQLAPGIVPGFKNLLS